MSIRLIDTDTLQMKTFAGRIVPEYAILSHTWIDGEEVTFEEMMEIPRNLTHTATRKKGYQKIKMTCRYAKKHNLRYAWVDTCTIDKKSSAELGEAINSMFRWYKNAKECYVYLADLPANASLSKELQYCRWFTRGWCLQELLAPSRVVFFDQSWQRVGSKSSLQALIIDLTEIDREVLVDADRLQSIPVARRMSWASHRVTTRVEDSAYCLLGIFDVNMPMLYGEGDKAFLRLQEEIMRRSNDLSIFCGLTSTHNPLPVSGKDRSRRFPAEEGSSESELELKRIYRRHSLPYQNLFAKSPSSFKACGETTAVNTTTATFQTFSLTNNVVHFPRVELQTLWMDATRAYYVLPLNCRDGLDGVEEEMLLYKVGPGLFVRLQRSWLNFRRGYMRAQNFEEDRLTVVEEAHILTTITSDMPDEFDQVEKSSITIAYEGNDLREALREASPQRSWDAANLRFITRGVESFEGFVLVYPYLVEGMPLQNDDSESQSYFYLTCGVDSGSHGRAWVRLYSTAQWKRYQSKYGTVVGFKFLNGMFMSQEDFMSDALIMSSITVQAKVSITHNQKVRVALDFQSIQ